MKPSILSLVPPLLTLIFAVRTREIRLSIFIGIVSAALISTNFSIFDSLTKIFHKLLEVTEISNIFSWQSFISSRNLFIFMFLIFLGCVIKLLKYSKVSLAYAYKVRNIAKTKTSAQFYAMALPFVLFMQADMGIITSSSIIPALTDFFKIPRIKVAYLISSLAIPLSSIAPISTWAAVIALFLENSGVSVQKEKMIFIGYPYFTYIYSIPFSFQAIFMIISAICIVAFSISFGIIGRHEEICERTGNLFGGEEQEKKPFEIIDEKKYSILDFFYPILTLPVAAVGLILFTGGHKFFAGENDFTKALINSKVELSLLFAVLISFFTTSIIFVLKKYISLKELFSSTKKGVISMQSSIFTLSLAWTFANFLRTDLKTGKYITTILLPYLSVKVVPVFSFALSAAMAFLIGSAWASMAVVFPICIPMLQKIMELKKPIFISQVPEIYPTIGAVMSGALLGVSLSPISYLVLLKTKNLAIKNFEFIKANFQYNIPVIISSMTAFYISAIPKDFGYTQNLALSIFSGILSYGFLILALKIKKRTVLKP